MDIQHVNIVPSSILSEEEMINVLGGEFLGDPDDQDPSNSEKCNKCDKCDKCTWFC